MTLLDTSGLCPKLYLCLRCCLLTSPNFKLFMHKVIINDCYGGFGYSPLALSEIYKRKHPEVKEFFFYKEGDYNWDTSKFKYLKCTPDKADYVLIKDKGAEFVGPFDEDDVVFNEWERHDPDCIAVVEQLGSEKASDSCGKLEIVEISDNKYIVHEYDGWEWLETPSTPKDWVEIP